MRDSHVHIIFLLPSATNILVHAPVIYSTLNRKSSQNWIESSIQVAQQENFSLSLLLWVNFPLCLGEKQGMLVNKNASSWYSRVGEVLVSVWDRRKNNYTATGSAHTARQNNTIPECVVNVTECLMVECEWFIYLFIYLILENFSKKRQHSQRKTCNLPQNSMLIELPFWNHVRKNNFMRIETEYLYSRDSLPLADFLVHWPIAQLWVAERHSMA